MNKSELRSALHDAVKAARAAGALMHRNLRETKRVNEATQHDVKLELDVRCQKTIERLLHTGFPGISLLGEEGNAGAVETDQRWVVDPIDGTVNFSHGIPHACVSIALQARMPSGPAFAARRSDRKSNDGARGRPCPPPFAYETILGVVYDPFTDELWSATRDDAARLDGKPIHVSRRGRLAEAIIATGFAKSRKTLRMSLPFFNKLIWRIRKVRIMGSAALALTYVATGRFDAYIERDISLWDIAAGGFIIERAGGEFWREEIPETGKFRMVASNGLLREKLRVHVEIPIFVVHLPARNMKLRSLRPSPPFTPPSS